MATIDWTKVLPTDETMSVAAVKKRVVNCTDAAKGSSSNADVAIATLTHHKDAITQAFQDEQIENISADETASLQNKPAAFDDMITAFEDLKIACAVFDAAMKV